MGCCMNLSPDEIRMLPESDTRLWVQLNDELEQAQLLAEQRRLAVEGHVHPGTVGWVLIREYAHALASAEIARRTLEACFP